MLSNFFDYLSVDKSSFLDSALVYTVLKNINNKMRVN